MSAPRPRSALRACWILVLLVVLPVLGLSAGVAAAQTDEPASTEREISVNVVDRQGTAERDDDEPVAEAVIVVLAPGYYRADPAVYPFEKLRPGVRLRPLGPDHVVTG